MNAHLHAWIEKNIRVQTNLENLEKKAFLKKFKKNLENSGKKTEKSGTQGKLRELFCMMVKTFQLISGISNSVEINCHILDSYYFSFNETILLIL